MLDVWAPLEGSIEEILAVESRPFPALAEQRLAAAVVRGGYPVESCRRTVDRLYTEGGIEERPDGAYDAVGTSLVNRGADPEAFFAHAQETHVLYERLFREIDNPVDYVYRTLQALAPDRQVKVARQADGRLYGPGIFRLYPTGKGHVPHFDSLRLREQWDHYAAARFQHQFAAVLCVQDTASDDPTGEARIYRQFWSPKLQPILDAEQFPAYAEEHHIPHAEVRLRAGDFYVFHPRNIHEVPLIVGRQPRVVFATFLGFSEDDPEVFVWS